MTRLKGLGRGLDALLAGTDQPDDVEALQTLSLDRIQPGKYQPRTRMDDAALEELAESIREHGVMQPILVRPIDGGRFEIVAGERRWRAAQRAGLAAVPALVKPVPDQSALALALIENIQREDLNPPRTGERDSPADRGVRPHPRRRRQGRRTLAERRQQSPAAARSRKAGAGIPDGRTTRTWDMRARSSRCRRASRRLPPRGWSRNGSSVRETERLVHQFAHPSRRGGKRHERAADPDTARLEESLAETPGAEGDDRIESRRRGQAHHRVFEPGAARRHSRATQVKP